MTNAQIKSIVLNARKSTAKSKNPCAFSRALQNAVKGLSAADQLMVARSAHMYR